MYTTSTSYISTAARDEEHIQVGGVKALWVVLQGHDGSSESICVLASEDRTKHNTRGE